LNLDLNSPLQKAVEQMAARTVTASPMTSREWELLPAEIRLRAMFSARVEHERTLAEMQSRITDAMAGIKREGATMDKARFVEEMRAMIRGTGYKRPDGVKQTSIRNLRSRARLELIWEMNQAQAVGYAKWLTDMDPDLLEASPCYELKRVEARQEPRDWFAIWLREAEKIHGRNMLFDGRMIAPKTSTIWTAISRFGTPWPPFDWGSGMGLRSVRRAEAEALGVIGADDPPQTPLSKPFNGDHSASVKGIPQERVDAIIADFAGDVELKDNRLTITPPPAATGEFRIPPVPDELAAAQDKAAAASAKLSESKAEKILAKIRQTTAAQRLGVDARAAGTPLVASERLTQSLIQFFAMTAGSYGVIRQLRDEPMRDAWWAPMDFFGVFSAISDWIGGEE
jgi:hypothetical protein